MQNEVLYKRWIKYATISFVIILITISFGYAQNNNIGNHYINTRILTPNNSIFFINKQKITQHATANKEVGDEENIVYYNTNDVSLSTNDIIKTKDNDLIVVLNDLSSVKIFPNSEVIFLKLGNTPSIKIVSGDFEIQTSTDFEISSLKNNINIRQGGVKIKQTEEYSKISNLYGSNTVDIYGKEDNFIISYPIPIQKTIIISKEIDKTNWDNIRLSKLNKELNFESFRETFSRESFLPKTDKLFEDLNETFFLREITSFSPKGKEKLDEKQFLETIKTLLSAIKSESPSLIKKNISDLKKWRDNPSLLKLKNLIPTIIDPITRYTLENELYELFEENNSTNILNLAYQKDLPISEELKYLYGIWQKKDFKSESKIVEIIHNKVRQHNKDITKLEEDYNLLTSFIEAYPGFVTSDIFKIKYTIELYLYDEVETKTEKLDIILSTFEKNLNIIALLIENNNGEFAQNIHKNMLINTINFEDKNKILEEYRKNKSELEKNILTLIDFYEDFLHSAKFNENIYYQYKDNKEKEFEAENIFKENITKENINNEESKEELPYSDFSETVKLLERYSILVDEKDISLVFSEGKLIYVQNATLDSVKKEKFSFVFNPEKNVIFLIVWENEDYIPPIQTNIPLNLFKSEHNRLLSNKQIKEEKKRVIPIQDWATEVKADLINDQSIESGIKRQLIKEKLEKHNILSRGNYMYVYGKTMEIKNALINYEEKLETKTYERKIKFDIRLDIDTWDVLSLKLQDFPERKIRISKLEKVYGTIITTFLDETERNNIKINAKNQFSSLSERKADVQDFKITNQENGIVSFKDLSITFQSKGKDADFYEVSGELNTKNQKLIIIDINNINDKEYTLKDVEISSLKEKINEIKYPPIVNKPVKSKDSINGSDEAEDIIQDTFENMEEILNDGDWL